MEKPSLTMAQQVAEAAAAFEKQRTGHAPQAVTVVLGDETLVITLDGPCRQPSGLLPRPPNAPLECRTSIASCSTAPPTGRGSRSNESPVSRCAKPRPRSNPR